MNKNRNYAKQIIVNIMQWSGSVNISYGSGSADSNSEFWIPEAK